MYTNKKDALIYLTEQMATNFAILTTDEIDAKVAEIVDSIPAASRAALGDNDYAIAANYFETWMAINKGNNKTTELKPGKKDDKPTKAAFVAPHLNEQADDALNKMIQDSVRSKLKTQAETEVTKLLFAQERLADVAGSDKWMAKINSTAELIKTFEDYKDKLVDTVENKKAYENAMAAIKQGAAVAPDFSKNYGRVLGAVVKVPDNTTKNMAIPALSSYLLTETLLMIPTGQSGIGVKITGVTPKTDNKMGSDVTAKGKLMPKFYGKTAAIDNHSFEFVNTPTSEKLDKKTVSTKFTFKIVDVVDGVKKEKTIRVRGVLENVVPVYQRKPEFAEAGFGEVTKSNFVPKNLSDEQIEEAKRTQKEIFAALSENKLENIKFSDAIESIVKEINEAGKTGASATASNFD